MLDDRTRKVGLMVGFDYALEKGVSFIYLRHKGDVLAAGKHALACVEPATILPRLARRTQPFGLNCPGTYQRGSRELGPERKRQGAGAPPRRPTVAINRYPKHPPHLISRIDRILGRHVGRDLAWTQGRARSI